MEKQIIVIAENRDGEIHPVTFELIAFAETIAGMDRMPIVIVAMGSEALECSGLREFGHDVVAAHISDYPGYCAETCQNVFATLLSDMAPAYICLAHTAQGSDYAPALAGQFDAACVTDIETIEKSTAGICFSRRIFAGKKSARIVSHTLPTICTVSPGIFKPKTPDAASPGNLKVVKSSFTPRHTRLLGKKKAPQAASSITDADVIVAAGNGIGDKENLSLLRQLAELFPHAAVAGSRPVCDRKWLDYNRQVGITGAVVRPKLYIACGISGASQHIAGMRESGFVVAINTDPNASICNAADICVVEDLKQFIPEFIDRIRSAREERSGVTSGLPPVNRP